MPAPDYETIFDVETAIEAAIKTVATTILGPSVGVFTTAEDVGKMSPYVAVKLETAGVREQKQFDNATPPNAIRSVWAARLTARIYTDRKKPTQDHPAIRKKLRLMMQPWKKHFTSAVLPYHAFTEIVDTGAPRLTEHDYDETEMQWDMVISVRKDAWPEVS